MAYTPHTWECEELVTPEKLNHIEQGIAECCGGGGGNLVVTVLSQTTSQACASGTDFTFDHTWQEMYDAIDAGTPVFIKEVDEHGISFGLVDYISGIEDECSIATIKYPNVIMFNTPTSNVGTMCEVT